MRVAPGPLLYNSSHFPIPRLDSRPRDRCSRAIAWLCVLGMLPAAATADPGLRPEPYVGPLSLLFYRPSAVGGLGSAGTPLLQSRARNPLLERDTPFERKSVVVDSNGVHYTPQTAGFDSGPPISLDLDEYLALGNQYVSRQKWRDTVRGGFRKASLAQVSDTRSRLEWRVPFPAPRRLRRIIGEEGTLRINGQHTATIAGKSSWTAGEVQTIAGRPSRFPALSMEQESNFAVEGSVGEAINIRITQDTQSFGQSFTSSMRDQLENQIKLDYKGDDDAVFQEVQAGNTTLSLPSTRFVGFNQQHKGLFGIRTTGHLGPMGFTTIASHEKSESNRRTFRGGAQVDTVSVRDYQYVRSTYFFLDEVYRTRLGDYREVAGTPTDYRPEDDIDERTLQVFINDFNVNNDQESLAQAGRAVVDVANPTEDRTGYIEEGTWHRLDPDNDYALVPQLGYLILKTSVPDRHALAVTYRTREGRQFGSVVAGEDLFLKLIKPRDWGPSFPTWDLEWKNVYRIVSGFSRGRKFEVNKIRIEILEEVPGREPRNSQNGKSLLQIMGLDTRGQDAGSQPDQIIDADYVGLDPDRGTIIFPDLTPFDPQHIRYGGLQNKVSEIYTKQQQRDHVEASRYIIQVINSSAQQRINLSQGRLANIDPESVEVRLNGKRLQRTTDYNVSFTGEVTFLGTAQQSMADPGADLEITYESQDILGLGSQQKTLLGMRGEYEFLQGDGMLGMTLLYNNVRSPDRRVRVGNEPARTVVWDLDMRARFAAPFLTRVVDALPLLRATEASDVSIQAEVAQSRPNLNTRGAGYIDDFEGSERPDLLSVYRTRWTPASLPQDPDLTAGNRGNMIWYNPSERVRRAEIWPGQADQYEANNSDTDILAMVLPARDDLGTTWDGVMTAFPGGNRDFSQAKFLEMWVRGDEGRVHLDLGNLPEDYRRHDLSGINTAGLDLRALIDSLRTPDGNLDTEDEPYVGRQTGDNQVSAEEDVGIDGRDDEEELAFYVALAGVDTSQVPRDQWPGEFQRVYVDGGLFPDRYAGDPEGDNWDYDRTRDRDNYTRINGTEGNRLKDNATGPNAEDLNNDGNLNNRNDYYHYTIDLADTLYRVPGTESNGWWLYRLPLYDQESPGVEAVGAADASRVEFARLVFEHAGFPGDTLKIEIAQIEIIANQWQEDDIVVPAGGDVRANESLNITVIGTDENQDYAPPPGVKRRRLTRSKAREREQSLVLDYTELDERHQASATRVLTQAADYTKYTRLQMYVHGDLDDVYVIDADSSDLEVFLRFGADSTNYYEFITPVFPGWDERNEVVIDLLTISQLKSRLQYSPEGSPERMAGMLDSVIARSGVRDGIEAVYRVRGRPSMQQIRQLTMGVRNRGGRVREYSGQVYADELRLDEARNDPGMAAFARVNTKLAGFMDVDGQVEWQAENFRTLANTERRSSDTKVNLTTTANAHKFLPGSWGFSIPVKATINRSLSLPRFGPNSDVELDNIARDTLRTESRKEYYEISISKRKSQHWLTNWTIDQMNLRMSQTRERSTDPVTPLRNRDAQTMSFSYGMPLPNSTLPILGWLPEYVPQIFTKAKLRYLPTTLNYAVNSNRQETASWRATVSDTTRQETFDLKETYSAKLNPLASVSTDYTLQVSRDLRKKRDLMRWRPSLGREVSRNQKGDVRLTLRWVKWLDQSYTFQANYDENSDPRARRTSASIDSSGRPIPTRDITTKNSASARLNLRLPNLLKQIGAKATAAPRGRAVDDSTAGPKQPFFLRRLLYFSGGVVEPLNTTWRRSTDARHFNLVARPPLTYQLGFDDTLKVERRGSGLTQQDSWSRSANVEVSSALKLPLGISVKPKYKRQQTRRSGSTQTRLRVEEQEFFPDITVNWGRADRLPFIKRYLTSAQVSLGYDETVTRQGEGGLTRGRLISRGETRDIEANWNGQWRWGPSTRIRVSRSTGQDLDFELASQTDTSQTANRALPIRGRGTSTKNTTSAEVKYRLRPRSLPLFGELKANVDLSLQLERQSEERSSATGDGEPAPIGATDRSKLEFKATYKFSESFRGQALIRLENNHNGLTDRTRKVREVRMSGTVVFR